MAKTRMRIGSGIGERRLNANESVGRALWGSVPRHGCPGSFHVEAEISAVRMLKPGHGKAIPPPWKPCCRITGSAAHPEHRRSSGKKNPAKPRPVVVANGPHV